MLHSYNPYGTSQAISYNGGDPMGSVRNWAPLLTSADQQMLPQKTIIDGRSRDLQANHGLLSGAVRSQKDRVIGPHYTLQLKPIARLLGVDPIAASKWASSVEVAFHAWADDPDCWIDSQRKRTFTQLLREAVGTVFVQGECFILRQWRPSPLGYSTCFQTIAPERVCTPNDLPSSFEIPAPNGENKIRAGIEFDSYGAAVAIWVRSKHKHDLAGSGLGATWERVTIFNEFGWRQVIYVFDSELADQTRGITRLTPAIEKLKMMDKQELLELTATALSTKFAMVVTSSGGQARADAMLGADADDEAADLQIIRNLGLIEGQSAYYGKSGVNLDGVKIPVLYPGDKVETIQAHDQPDGHDQFKQGLIRQAARSAGMSTEEFSGDYTNTNYSSGRLSHGVSWLSTLSERANISEKIATHIFRLWFDEYIVRGGELPPGVAYWPSNSIVDSRVFSWLTRCTWIGSGRPVIDELKTAKAHTENLGNSIESLSDVLAESGRDLESVLDSRLSERLMFEERGLPIPAYLSGVATTQQLSDTNTNEEETSADAKL